MNFETIFSAVALIISLGAIFLSWAVKLNDLKHLEENYKELKKEVETLRNCLEELKRKFVEIDTKLNERFKE